MKRKTRVFPKNHSTGTTHDRMNTCGVGPSGPPRNKVTTMADIVIVFMNSAMKNSANRIEEYSVLKPPTSSCSASTRSNGGRVSSAVMAIMNKKKGRMPVWMRYQLPKNVWDWCSTMARVDNEPASSTTMVTVKPRAAS